MTIEIVHYSPQHRGAVEELWKEFMDFHAQRDPWFQRSEDGHRRFGEYLTGLQEASDALVLVALEGRRVIGYGLARIEARPPVYQHFRHGLISDIAVAGTHRRKGIGARIEERMLQWFATQGIDHVELMAVAANEVSNAFWKRRGYRPQATIYARSLR
jgi:GNAT superfamily N-acetyltransferase